MKVHNPIEVAQTVLEVADAAWAAMECCHHYTETHKEAVPYKEEEEKESAALSSENKRLRQLLEENLKLLQHISQPMNSLQDCPSDLHDRLLAAVDSGKFLKQLEFLRPNSISETVCTFPFNKVSDVQMGTVETMVNFGLEEPSLWVWVTDEMVPSSYEERSGIDRENYVVVNSEEVVDAVSNFMAKCILSNRKALNMTPQELQKTLRKAMGSMSKLEKLYNIWHAGMLFYALSAWGLALAGVCGSGVVLKHAVKGVHIASGVVMKAL